MAVLTTSYQKIGTGSAQSFNGTIARIDLYAKYNSQSILNNNTVWSIEARLVKESSYGYIGEYTGTTLTLSGDGISSTQSLGTGNFQSQTLGSASGTVTHNSDGTKSVSGSASIYFKAWGQTLTVSGSADLPKIARQTSLTGFNVYKRNETSLIFEWSASDIVDYVWCSIDNGYSWNGYDVNDRTSGNIVVEGLAPNTTYTCKITVRRRDSQLNTESGATQQTTYQYPYCTSTPNFVIGNALTLTLYNPLNRNVSVVGYSSNGTQIFYGTTTGTVLTGFNDSSSTNIQYSTIPNSTSGRYKVVVYYDSVVMTTDLGNTYSINVNECKPIFTNFEYSTNLSELTGDNATVINERTVLTFIINPLNKAIGKNGATIQRYSFECGNQLVLANYSNGEVRGTIANCASDIIKATAIDSRGLETTISKTVTNFKNYFPPTFMSFNVNRENGIDSIAYLNLKLQFWNYNFGLKDNKIKLLNYRIKQQCISEWSEWYSINLNKLSINKEQVVLQDYLIYIDGVSQGFTVGVTYNIQLKVIDGSNNYNLSTVESSVFDLSDGKVAFSVLKDSNGEYHIGINGMPDINYTLKVHGTISNS